MNETSPRVFVDPYPGRHLVSGTELDGPAGQIRVPTVRQRRPNFKRLPGHLIAPDSIPSRRRVHGLYLGLISANGPIAKLGLIICSQTFFAFLRLKLLV